jgi:hypothetical protein
VHELLHLRFKTHGKVCQALLNACVPGWQSFDLAAGEPLLRSQVSKSSDRVQRAAAGGDTGHAG